MFDLFLGGPGPQKLRVRVQKTYKNVGLFVKIASPGRYRFLTKINKKRFLSPNCIQKSGVVVERCGVGVVWVAGAMSQGACHRRLVTQELHAATGGLSSTGASTY